MRRKTIQRWLFYTLFGCAPGLFTASADVVLTTNKWTITFVSGKWEDATKWSASAPSFTDAADFISNMPVLFGPVVVTVDFNTANDFPDTMMISILTVGGHCEQPAHVDPQQCLPRRLFSHRIRRLPRKETPP